MAKQPFQLAKIHLVAVVRRLAKGILQQFSTIKRDYFGEGAIVCIPVPLRRRLDASTFALRAPTWYDAFHAAYPFLF